MSDLETILEKADTDTINEIIREAESYLQSQLSAAIAADQRAIGFASMLAAATAVVGAGAVTLLVGQGDHYRLALAGLVVAAGFILSMLCAIVAARPVDFEFAGNDPKHWLDDVNNGQKLARSLAQQAAHYSVMIQENNRTARTNMRWMQSSIWLAWIFLVLGFVIILSSQS